MEAPRADLSQALNCPLTTPPKRPDPGASISMRVRGGVDAPGRARRAVLSQLDGRIAATTASDIGLVVSELVTNSVVHANVGPQRSLTVELSRLDDRVRISVVDPGSRLEPRVLPPDDERVGGRGLFVVSELSDAWGVVRDRTGRSRVWCEILLDRSSSPEIRAVAGEPPTGS
jgi:anti-sigma regulatory factor (Ser/Thr protein kinase)